MIKDEIVHLIMDARKSGDKDKVQAYQDLKNEFMKFQTAKNAGVLDEAAEFQILRKLIKECQDAAVMNNDGKHDELVESNKKEAEILSELLPAGPSDSDIRNAVEELLTVNLDFNKNK